MPQPAARLGDMHTWPMQTPGVPAVPHVSGPVLPPGWPQVAMASAALERESALTPLTPPLSHALDVGSGSGGGVLEIPMFVAHQGYHTETAEAFAKMFPGAATFVYGSQVSAVMFGDSNTHVLGGASISMVIDLEAMTVGALIDKLPILGPLMGGVGGSAAFVCGPNASLVYGGPNRAITRGDDYQYQTGKFWTDLSAVGVVTKLLTVLIAAATTVGDVLARQKAHFQYARTSGEEGQAKDDEHHEKEDTAVSAEYPEWAIFVGTAIPSRLLALLIQIETVKAEVENAKAKGEEANHHAAHAAALAANPSWLKRAANRVKAGFRATRDCLKTLATYDGETAPGNKLQVFEGNWGLKARDVTFTSQDADPTNVAGTHLSLISQGGPAGNNGAMTLSASSTVEMGAGPSKIGVEARGPTDGVVEVLGPAQGFIRLHQGPVIGGFPDLTMTGTPPSIKLAVGPPGLGSSIEMTATGITIKFAEWSIALDAGGITLNVTPNNVLMLGPAGVALGGLKIHLAAKLQHADDAVMLELNADGLQKIQTALSQME